MLSVCNACFSISSVYKAVIVIVFLSFFLAYKEKMKEISVLSLICSCLYPESRKNIMGDFEGKHMIVYFLHCFIKKSNRDQNELLSVFLSFFLSHADLDIKPINKRASGQAFEVILKPSSPVSDVAYCITSPPKRDVSLEDIQKKLEAAEDRRRVRMLPINVTAPSCFPLLKLKATKA